MELFPKHIKLNGQLTDVQELLKKTDFEFEWEREWFDFLREWYSQSGFVETKTSGSTGTPQTIKLKKEFVAASAKRTLDFFNLEEDDRVLHCLPSRFIAGKLMTVRALIGKLDVKVVDPASDFSFLKNEKFEFAALVPTQMMKLISSQPETRNPKLILIGGSAIPHALEQKLQSIPTQCYSSYGMTETATHIALRKINGDDADKFYHCLENIKVDKSENDCLQIYMPGLDQSFLQTTDIAELKDEHTFRIRGRSDHVIISGGIKYSPEEIEKKLEPHIKLPFYISSLPDETLGEQIILMIEGTESFIMLEQLEHVCQKILLRYECPRKIVFQEKLKRTENGKLIRRLF